MTALRLPAWQPGALVRAAQAWRIERQRRRVQRHIDYLTAHREQIDFTLGILYRERSRLGVARLELDRLP